jgi:hypothetical protein
MKNVKDLKTYHLLFEQIRDKPRYKLWELAKVLGLSGRGRTTTTASKYINRLYDYKISLRPNLILRNFENSYLKGYFLKIRKNYDEVTAYRQLIVNPFISYIMFLSGKYDFLVTTRENDFDFKKYGLSVAKKSLMSTPLFTIPQGWKVEMKNAIKDFASSNLVEGKLNRTMEDYLPWDSIHFKIHKNMMYNIQIHFAEIAKAVNISSTTVKTHYEKMVLPYCNIAHYFFPKGYDYYDQSLILLETRYEKGLVKSLCKLPCTTYVYPIETEILLNVFHEGINDLMCAFKNLKRKKYISRYRHFTPLYWW